MHFSQAAPVRLHNCAGPHEHGEIAAGILAGKAEKASQLMLAHLGGLVQMQSAPLPAPKGWRFQRS